MGILRRLCLVDERGQTVSNGNPGNALFKKKKIFKKITFGKSVQILFTGNVNRFDVIEVFQHPAEIAFFPAGAFGNQRDFPELLGIEFDYLAGFRVFYAPDDNGIGLVENQLSLAFFTNQSVRLTRMSKANLLNGLFEVPAILTLLRGMPGYRGGYSGIRFEF